MKFATAYENTKRVSLGDFEETLTEQSHAKQCDINYILKDYAKGQLAKHVKEHEGKYDDYTGYDFTQAQNVVAEVKTMFEELPAPVRNEFGNEPANFLDFVQKPENAPYLKEMGIEKGLDGWNHQGVRTLADVEATEKLAMANKLKAAEGALAEANASQNATQEQASDSAAE